jgi:protein-disulfide isomerase
MKMIRHLGKSALLIGGLAALVSQPAFAEINEKDFDSAIGKYLETQAGQEKLGKAIQSYFARQQESQREEQAKRQQEAVEEQFKNPVKIDAGTSPAKGPADAPITIVEFSDFECPFCSRGKTTMDEVMAAYPGKVKLVFKNLPLPFHKRADPAARAALAAGEQGKFWEMHDAMFNNQRGLTDEFFVKTATDLKLDVAKFKADMESEKVKNQVKDDMKVAQDNGISGTPGFAVNGVLVKGAYPIDHFKMIVDRWLKEKQG